MDSAISVLYWIYKSSLPMNVLFCVWLYAYFNGIMPCGTHANFHLSPSPHIRTVYRSQLANHPFPYLLKVACIVTETFSISVSMRRTHSRGNSDLVVRTNYSIRQRATEEHIFNFCMTIDLFWVIFCGPFPYKVEPNKKRQHFTQKLFDLRNNFLFRKHLTNVTKNGFTVASSVSEFNANAVPRTNMHANGFVRTFNRFISDLQPFPVLSNFCIPFFDGYSGEELGLMGYWLERMIETPIDE